MRLALAIVALAAWTSAARAQGEVVALRVGLPAVVAALDPATARDASTAMIVRQVYDTLVQYREGGSDIEPGLATQWSVSKDGLTWTFRLREGVRFHDGTALAVGHVVTSLERQLVPGHPLAPAGPAVGPRLLRGAPGVVREITATDTNTIRIKLNQPYAALPTVLGHPGLAIVLPAATEGATRWLGTGPFAVTEIGGGQVVLDAQPGYWGGRPRPGRVVFVAEPDPARALAAIEARTLHIWLPASAPPRGVAGVSVPGWRLGYLALQTEKEPFSRRKVRHAIAAAIDPAAIGAVVEPESVVAQSFLPPGVWGRRPGPPITLGAPDVARRLLGEAGLARGTSATLVVASDVEEQGRLAEALRVGLDRAGIALRLQPSPAAKVMALAQNGEHQMVLMEAEAEGGDPHILLYPLSASEGATRGPSAWNLSFFKNARLDDLLIRGSQLSFRAERERVYARAQALLGEELPWIPLYVRRHWAVVRPEVRGLRLHPSGQHRLDRVILDFPRSP
jgi:peptide/nickel transport system substrate-binding protein